MKKVNLLSLSLFMILSGCWSANQVDKYYYAYTLGVDFVDGMYDVYIQFFGFAPSNDQKGEPGATVSSEPGVVGHGRGKTLDTAIHNVYKTTPLNTYWGHLSVIIFSKRMLENDYFSVIDFQTRYKDGRFTPWIFVTDEPFEDLLDTHPFFSVGIAYSLYADPLKDYEQSSIVLPLRLHNFLANSYEQGRTNIVPFLTLNKKVWTSARKPVTSIAVSGASMIKGLQYKGTMKNDLLGGLRWMSNTTERAPLIIQSKDAEEPTGVVIINQVKANIKPNIVSNEARFNVDVTVSGVIVEMYNDMPIAEFIQEGERQIRDEIMKTFDHALKMNADIYQLADSLYRKHPKQFHQLKKSDELPITEQSIDHLSIKLKVKHTGKLKYHPLQKRFNHH